MSPEIPIAFQTAFNMLVGAIGCLSVVLLTMLIRKVNSIEGNTEKKLEVMSEAFQEAIRKASSDTQKIVDRLEANQKELHNDQEQSKKNCHEIVTAIRSENSNARLHAVQTFAEKLDLQQQSRDHKDALNRLFTVIDDLRKEISAKK